MAVLEAVRGWETIAGLPHINDVKKDDESDSDNEDGSSNDEEEELEPGMWSSLQLEHQLDGLLNSDYEGLLLEHDRHVGAGSGSDSLCKLVSRCGLDIFLLTCSVQPSFLHPGIPSPSV